MKEVVVSHEALHRHLYPPLLIWTLEAMLFPWTYWMSVVMAPAGRAPDNE